MLIFLLLFILKKRSSAIDRRPFIENCFNLSYYLPELVFFLVVVVVFGAAAGFCCKIWMFF